MGKEDAPPPLRATRNEPAKARYLECVRTIRALSIEAARLLVQLDRDGHFLYEGCGSIGEFGERHGEAASRTLERLSLGHALEVFPALEERILVGAVPVEAVSLIGRVVAN